jgi:hypothetical protein
VLNYCSRTPDADLRWSVARGREHFAAAPRTVGVMAFVANGPDATVKPANIQTIPARTVARNLLNALINLSLYPGFVLVL